MTSHRFVGADLCVRPIFLPVFFVPHCFSIKNPENEKFVPRGHGILKKRIVAYLYSCQLLI